MRRDSVVATGPPTYDSAGDPPAMLPLEWECRRCRGWKAGDGGDLCHDCGSAPAGEGDTLLHLVGIAERWKGAPEPPTREQVRRLRRAMAHAPTWEELFALAQCIWSLPVIEGRSAATSARARLCNAYAQAVDRLWNRCGRRRNRARGARTGGIAA